jgi:cyclic pyranopterin phosphate synthase
MARTPRAAPRRQRPPAAGLTHVDARGRARMVDVGVKPETAREAVAEGRIELQAATLAAISAGTVAKGDVLAAARLAGIQAAKRCSELIPLCHPLRLTAVAVELTPRPAGPALEIRATVRAFDRTGVEMEALTAVAVAALTVYDMCKAIDRGMTIAAVRLRAKRGGRSGAWERPRGA